MTTLSAARKKAVPTVPIAGAAATTSVDTSDTGSSISSSSSSAPSSSSSGSDSGSSNRYSSTISGGEGEGEGDLTDGSASASYLLHSYSTSRFRLDDSELEHLTTDNTKIAPYWLEQLAKMEKKTSRDLIAQLVPDNELGYDWEDGGRNGAKRGSGRSPPPLISICLEWRRQHPEKVVLVRNGEFYETFGMDALMMIDHSGLNAMGGKAKAGCPVKNIQGTLDGLTGVGLSVAVFEEVIDTNVHKGPAKTGTTKNLKHRAFSQVVSPATSMYVYDLTLRADDIDFRPSVPFLGIMHTDSSGYVLCEVHVDEKTLTVRVGEVGEEGGVNEAEGQGSEGEGTEGGEEGEGGEEEGGVT